MKRGRDDADEGLRVASLGDYATPGAVPNFLPSVFISLADGTTLENTSGLTVSLKFGDETFASLDGTSMAAPHAAAVAALAWAVAPSASSTEIASAVENTAVRLGDSNTYGYGLVDALAAAESLDPAAFGISGGPPGNDPSGKRAKN